MLHDIALHLEYDWPQLEYDAQPPSVGFEMSGSCRGVSEGSGSAKETGILTVNTPEHCNLQMVVSLFIFVLVLKKPGFIWLQNGYFFFQEP